MDQLNYDVTGLEAAPLYQSDVTLSPEDAAHVRMYKKFVTAARLAALSTPLMMAFVLYWMR